MFAVLCYRCVGVRCAAACSHTPHQPPVLVLSRHTPHQPPVLSVPVSGLTRRAGTDSLARLRRQGGGEVNDGNDADDSDDERRWRPLMPMLMNPATSGAPAVSGTMPIVRPDPSHVTPTPTLRDWYSRVLLPLYSRGDGDGRTITYPDKLSHVLLPGSPPAASSKA